LPRAQFEGEDFLNQDLDDVAEVALISCLNIVSIGLNTETEARFQKRGDQSGFYFNCQLQPQAFLFPLIKTGFPDLIPQRLEKSTFIKVGSCRA